MARAFYVLSCLLIGFCIWLVLFGTVITSLVKRELVDLLVLA